MSAMRRNLMRKIANGLTALGAAGLLTVCVAYLHATVGSHQAIAAFEAAVAAQALGTSVAADPDQSLWSEKRKQAFAAVAGDPAPLALLEIERLGLRVPVYPGTDKITLNRGAGIVEGTAFPGESGNMVVSAHRDGFFRALKDIRVGDKLAVRTPSGAARFAVREIFITDPLDLSVLEPTDTPVVTLITCYPFYYVGFAPERLIVRALPLEG
jgi:sortase A